MTSVSHEPRLGTEGAEDASLVSAARAGDRDAFARLYERYAVVIHGVLLASVPTADAEDLTQEVFVTAMRKLSDLRDAGAVGGWLMTAARNRAASWARDRAKRPRLALAAEPASRGPNGLSAEEVMEAIRSLPEAYREPLALRLVEGLSGPEIAARTGMTHGSVRVNLHKGMEMLRSQLAGGAR